jgi:predicted metalloprotease with PDZ domain
MAAGVMVGERVTAIDGVGVSSVDDVVAAIKRHQPGEVMKLTLAARTTTTSTSAGSSGAAGQSATTSTTVPGSGQSPGSTAGSAGTRTISVVLAAYAPTV